MAVYHFSVTPIGRAQGRSAIREAVYRSQQDLYDERQGVTLLHDPRKSDAIHSEVFLPEGAPDRFRDRATLWNAVEAAEGNSKRARVARSIVASIPRELDRPDAIRVARDFARTFVAQGMVADLSIHWKQARDGGAQPHLHLAVTTRNVGPDGFKATKNRDWDRRSVLVGWRKQWAATANERLAEAGFSARIDHRTLAEQGRERARLRDRLRSLVDRVKDYWSTIRDKLSKGMMRMADEPKAVLTGAEREAMANDLGRIHANSTPEFWAKSIREGRLHQDIDQLEAQVRASIKPHQAKA